MKKFTQSEKRFILLCLALSLCITSVIITIQRTQAFIGHINCGSFHYQEDAQNAYKKGAHWLDGYDRDGKVCESLPKKQ